MIVAVPLALGALAYLIHRTRKAAIHRKDRPVTAITTPALSHLRALEAEAIHVMREVAAEREKPALLFSGGKDSIVLVRLARRRSRRAASRSRCCTSTPGTTSPR